MQIALGSSRLRLGRSCQLSSVLVTTFEPALLCPTDQIFPSCFGARPNWLTRFCAGRNPPIFPWNTADKYELIVNLTTAKAIGLKVPDSFLLRADEVIE
jgi:hypothetical protein